MSHPGEILGNADIVRPETAVITNIGLVNMNFENTGKYFQAKSKF